MNFKYLFGFFIFQFLFSIVTYAGEEGDLEKGKVPSLSSEAEQSLGTTVRKSGGSIFSFLFFDCLKFRHLGVSEDKVMSTNGSSSENAEQEQEQEQEQGSKKIPEEVAVIEIFDPQELLQRAVIQGDQEAVVKFLKAGIDPKEENEKGQTSLHLAAQSILSDKKMIPILAALLESGGDSILDRVDLDGFTPLGTALLHCNVNQALFMIEHGAYKIQSTENINPSWEDLQSVTRPFPSRIFYRQFLISSTLSDGRLRDFYFNKLKIRKKKEDSPSRSKKGTKISI